MFRKFIFIIFILEILYTFEAVDVFGFGSNYTHPSITKLAIENIVENGRMDRYLKEELDIKDGIDSSFSFYRNIDSGMPESEVERNNDVIVKDMRRGYPTRLGGSYTGRYLLISGSEAEDHPTERAQHHFLDPISNKGLDNNYYGVGVVADFLALFYPPAEQGNVGRFLCSLMALCEPSFNLNGTAAVDRIGGKTSVYYPPNYFAWPDTRRYFYNALTATTKEEREHYSALTFFSLGHNLHILEDMGVPAHTRNDFIYDHIWHGIVRGSYLEGYLESGGLVEGLTDGAKMVSFSRLADFLDNDNTRDKPGLAEYTNYNFLSEGTVFNTYEHPEWISIETYENIAEDGKRDIVQYYTGRTSDNIDISHLAAVGLLNSSFGFLDYKDRAKRTAYLDPYCYKDYSEILIPRVVSYVSGLIEYFFRGRIAVIKDATGGFKIKNLSAEPINRGIFEIYYDSTNGKRNSLVSYELAPETSLMPGGVTDRITFTPPLDNITPGRFIVVFKGRLGEEDNAVIGNIIRDKIYFVSERRAVPEIYSMNMDGTDIKVLVSNDAPDINYTHPVVSPDGTKIAFHSNRDGRDGIWIRDNGTGSIRRITDGLWPDWSPDGRRLVYYNNIDGKSDIFIIDTENPDYIRLTNDSYKNLWPAWSPDGTKIAYTSQRESKGDIVVLEMNSNLMQNLTVSIDNLDRWKPAWSPDGRRIAYEKPTKVVYATGEPFFVNIHALDIDTGTEINLTSIDGSNKDFGVWNGTPRWVDNQNIAIESNVSGEPWSDLWIIDAGGGFIKRLTYAPGHDGYPFIW